MDKFNSRLSLGAISKQQDSKKDNKQWPRNGRRRESGNDNGHKNHNQQVQHQRSNYDKRARGNVKNFTASTSFGTADHQSNSSGAGLEEEDEDFYFEPELNSVLVPGSKKQNLNHLLNFHYAPRSNESFKTLGKGGNKKKFTQSKSFNKEHFIQANCQFIVKEGPNYKSHIICPDNLVNWEQIEQVIIRNSEEPKCPICLYPPIASRMTKCGHVYCWPCILHYLALSDKEWRKCPICYDPIQIKDLKSTESWPYHAYQVKETVYFHLMYRQVGSTLVKRVDDEMKADTDFPHFTDVNPDKSNWSKLILANREEISSIIERENIELSQQLVDGCPESVFIEQAQNLLQERRNQLLESQGLKTEIALLEESLDLINLNQNDYVFFYQSLDGQYLFLHSLNIKMLQAQFGEISLCPRTISGEILQCEVFSMSEELRKKLKYLNNLPLTCTFTIAEIKFEDGLISKEVQEQFAEEINQRKKRRQKKRHDEDLREKHINKVFDRKMGKMMSDNIDIHLESKQLFPFVFDGAIEDQPSSSLESNKPELSFAKMLSSEQIKTELWPTLEIPISSKHASPLSPNPKSSKKDARMDAHFPYLLDTIELEDEPVNDAMEKCPQNFKASFKSAPNTIDDEPKINRNIAKKMVKGETGKKNKKKQQLLLFSTGMNFKGN